MIGGCTRLGMDEVILPVVRKDSQVFYLYCLIFHFNVGLETQMNDTERVLSALVDKLISVTDNI